MKFNLQFPTDVKRSDDYYSKLKRLGKDIELKEIRQIRSLKQNSYLHVIITLYAIYFGSTLLEAKTDLKRACDFMRYTKNGNIYLKSTAKLDSKELTEFIDWLRNYSAFNGCYLPTPEEYLTQKFNIDKEIDSHKRYL